MRGPLNRWRAGYHMIASTPMRAMEKSVFDFKLKVGSAIGLFAFGAFYPALALAFPHMDDGQDRQAPVPASLTVSGAPSSLVQIQSPSVMVSAVNLIIGDEYAPSLQLPDAAVRGQ